MMSHSGLPFAALVLSCLSGCVSAQGSAEVDALNQAALDKCLWTALGLVKPSSVAFTASWQIMVDDPFSINSNLPTW